MSYRCGCAGRALHKIYADFEAELIQMDGDDNHIHLWVEYYPKLQSSSTLPFAAEATAVTVERTETRKKSPLPRLRRVALDRPSRHQREQSPSLSAR
ncbi:transposase [Allomesorhizobium camelthorni]|uniref:Transposase IS200-like domain-containing protein n=1 Tax=Allomesorhizobium camelthorni TaxID=475069 RepID=A0A6G4WPL2_9HYPH|nr:hypothetical protein [Mesorhizobium camelthorni]